VSGRRAIAAAIGAAVVVGIGSGVAWAAFSSTTTNGPNSFSAKSDLRAPTADATTGARAIVGATAGVVRQGVGYYIYANVSDAGNPASGVQTVTANVSSFDTGVTAASLTTTGGPWTVGGTSYTRRSALLTANTPLTTGSTYSYSLTMTDVAGNSATSSGFTVTIEAYSSVIASTSGLVSYWPLGDGSISADEFTNTAGTGLSSHTGGVGATWTSMTGQARTAVITSQNRVRKETGTGGALYYTSALPPSADYLVEADVHVKSLVLSDSIGVIGRFDVAGDRYYRARYEVSNARWAVEYVLNGTALGAASN
jgi:hypothetical protein